MSQQSMRPAASTSVDQMIEDAVRDIGIPPRPTALEKINAEMCRDEPDPGRLAAIISADVSLSAGILKTANSPFFGLRTRARTVQQALMLLGMDIACRAAMGLLLRNTFPRVRGLERFWDASARIAQISGWMAGGALRHPDLEAGEAYTFALFRDCGIAVMMRKFPDYGDTLTLANASEDRGFTQIEQDRHPTNHAVVGCLLARSWWLPEHTSLAIRHHHDVPAIAAGSVALPAVSARMIALAQFAERIVQTTSGLSLTREWDKMGSLCLGLLGIDASEEARITEAAGRLSAEGDD